MILVSFMERTLFEKLFEILNSLIRMTIFSSVYLLNPDGVVILSFFTTLNVVSGTFVFCAGASTY